VTTCFGYDKIYLLTATGLSPGGSSTIHIYTQKNTQNNTINKNTINNLIGKSAGRVPSLRVLPWHLHYN